jgi:hypothetical protein
MRKTLAPVAVSGLLALAWAAAILPAQADGLRRPSRGSPYPVGAISRNVITPYYVGYYGSHYSYYRPDPVPPPTYVRYLAPPVLCWTPELGYLPC